MAINDATGPDYNRPRRDSVAETRKAQPGLSAESLGAVVGAIVGSAATAFLNAPKGQSLNPAEGLKAGAKTAGAIMVGQMGLLAGEAAGSALHLVKDAQVRADEWLAQTDSKNTSSDRDRIAVDEEESRLSDHSHGQGL